MYAYCIDYLFNNESRTHQLELKQPQMTLRQAAMHLLELHFGDGENSLMMPNADAADEEVLEQAELVGLSQIRVTQRSV